MPATDGVRSLNLATAVAIAAYEGLRQTTVTG
jgi:tRNA(Leu) C34 or U34 (ribose-2'-O)-methylase TrmL